MLLKDLSTILIKREKLCILNMKINGKRMKNRRKFIRMLSKFKEAHPDSIKSGSIFRPI